MAGIGKVEAWRFNRPVMYILTGMSSLLLKLEWSTESAYRMLVLPNLQQLNRYSASIPSWGDF